jgi:hypothetical protein
VGREPLELLRYFQQLLSNGFALGGMGQISAFRRHIHKFLI